MLKKCLLPSLLLCAILNTSCEKETLTPVTGKSLQVNQSYMRLGDTNLDNPATCKGLYVDGANNIIGNITKENNLINYALNKGFNGFTFYGLKSVISTSANYSKMASFLSRCYQNGITNL